MPVATLQNASRRGASGVYVKRLQQADDEEVKGSRRYGPAACDMVWCKVALGPYFDGDRAGLGGADATIWISR